MKEKIKKNKDNDNVVNSFNAVNISDEGKVISLVAFANKAGKVLVGIDTIIANIYKKKIKLVLIPSNLDKEVVSKFVTKLTNFKKENDLSFEILVFGDKEEYFKYFGKSEKLVIGIFDKNFVQGIKKKIGEVIHGKN